MRVAITGASGLLGGNLAAELHRGRPRGDRHAPRGHAGRASRGPADRVARRRARRCREPRARVRRRRRRVPLRRGGVGNARGHARDARDQRRRHAPRDRRVHRRGRRRAWSTPRRWSPSACRPNGKPCDETATWNFDREGLLDAYAITKHEAEEVVNGARDRLDCGDRQPDVHVRPARRAPELGQADRQGRAASACRAGPPATTTSSTSATSRAG